METVDLHTHSTCSDGTFTPAELLAYARKKKLSAIALTDHDTLAGLHEGLVAATFHGVELVPGVELSTSWNGREIHILGLFVNPADQNLAHALAGVKAARAARNSHMLNLLNAHGVKLTAEDIGVDGGKNHRVTTRAHFAKAIVAGGYADTVPDAFSRYLSAGRPTYVPKKSIPVAETFRLIQGSGGLAALAHPMLYRMTHKEIEQMVGALKAEGLHAIESLYSVNSWDDDIFLAALASKYNLGVTGGSDFHGETKKHIDLGTGKGRLYVPRTVLDNLKHLRRHIIFTQ